MRPFEDLIKEIEVDGVRFVPIDSIMSLLGIYKPEKSNVVQEADIVGVYFYSNGELFFLSLRENYNVNLFNVTRNEFEFVRNQLQIFQALTHWGFIQMPFEMPSDDEIIAYIDTDYTLKFNDIKQALEHFIIKGR